MNISIANRLLEFRKKSGLSQEELAERLNISRQSVSKWENNQSLPDIALLPVIARYFGITMDELFNYRLDALNYKERFIRFMVNNRMLQFGEFTLKSGRKSPYLIHSGYNLTGSQISKLGEFYAECIREHNIDGNCLVGIDSRDVPLVIATSMTLFNKYGIDSFHCVDFGIKNDAFEHLDITLITDAFTSGKTLRTYLDNIKSQTGKYPSDIVVCVDRMEKDEHSSYTAKHEIEKEYGVKIHPIVNYEDIMKAVDNCVISAGDYTEQLKIYRDCYRGM